MQKTRGWPELCSRADEARLSAGNHAFEARRSYRAGSTGTCTSSTAVGPASSWNARSALARMSAGRLAYGDQGRPPTLPGHATLVFEIELVAAEPAMDAGASPPNIPTDIRAP